MLEYGRVQVAAYPSLCRFVIHSLRYWGNYYINDIKRSILYSISFSGTKSTGPDHSFIACVKFDFETIFSKPLCFADEFKRKLVDSYQFVCKKLDEECSQSQLDSVWKSCLEK